MFGQISFAAKDQFLEPLKTLSSVAPPHQHSTEWNCQAAFTVPGGL
jgi:hypothetical protein